MKTRINHPVASKINGLAIAILAIGIANEVGYIPDQWHTYAIEAATLPAPVLVVISRSFFTAPTA